MGAERGSLSAGWVGPGSQAQAEAPQGRADPTCSQGQERGLVRAPRKVLSGGAYGSTREPARFQRCFEVRETTSIWSFPVEF